MPCQENLFCGTVFAEAGILGESYKSNQCKMYSLITLREKHGALVSIPELCKAGVADLLIWLEREHPDWRDEALEKLTAQQREDWGLVQLKPQLKVENEKPVELPKMTPAAKTSFDVENEGIESDSVTIPPRSTSTEETILKRRKTLVPAKFSSVDRIRKVEMWS